MIHVTDSDGGLERAARDPPAWLPAWSQYHAGTAPMGCYLRLDGEHELVVPAAWISRA
jgi:hypothetical protein